MQVYEDPFEGDEPLQAPADQTFSVLGVNSDRAAAAYEGRKYVREGGVVV